ncbi:kelch repeat-containing protein [Actinoallomurus sp. NPDC052274]|uniref:carboxypeptidase regulatory-like domain-containing protein n=1 Tax=Actinoallomurus sp. NPDC052274 TaxID=3155420 RepID=UPI003432E642
MRYLPVRLGVILAAAVSVVLAAVGPANAESASAPAPHKTTKAAPARHTPRHFKPTSCNAPVKRQRKKKAERPSVSCHAMVGATTDDRAIADTDGPADGALGPADIKAAYDLPDGGAGATVAVVDAYGDTHAEADLAVFRAHYGLPPCTTANGCFRKVDQNGGTSYPADEEGWITETSLDLDAVSAACPKCNILLVQGDDEMVDSLGAAVDTAVRLGAKYVSNSYGVSGEFPGESGLGGRLYVIGGLVAGSNATVPAVHRYDPARDRWTELADYPVPVAGAACVGLGGQIVCAGGQTNGTGIKSTYLYHPDTDTWIKGADMPYNNWGMTYSGADGRLQVAAGISGAGDVATNQAAEYDPATDTWSALPNANDASYNAAGGSDCGLYHIGGGVYDGGIAPTRWAETLPGYDHCGDGFHLSWAKLSIDALDLAPGRSATVTVTISSAGFAQPGTITGALAFRTDTPYTVPTVPITVQADPPKGWGKLAGTVTDASTGKPIAGATVQLCAGYDTETGDCGGATSTLKTDTDGRYQTWLDQANNTLQVIAAKDTYQQQLRIIEIRAGATTTLDFQLQP